MFAVLHSHTQNSFSKLELALLAPSILGNDVFFNGLTQAAGLTFLSAQQSFKLAVCKGANYALN